jgi:hypothetical protein
MLREKKDIPYMFVILFWFFYFHFLSLGDIMY